MQRIKKLIFRSIQAQSFPKLFHFLFHLDSKCPTAFAKVADMKVKYTIQQFNEQFPDDDACLQYLFDQQFPNGGTCKCGKSDCFHKVTGRKKFACAWCGFQIAPTAGTIFHKSSTSLRTWFHAMFVMTARFTPTAWNRFGRSLSVPFMGLFTTFHRSIARSI
jgi:hypothetical protein